MAKDEYGIYRKPAITSIAAWLGVSAAIFFGAYSMNLRGRLSEVSKSNSELRQEVRDLNKARFLNTETAEVDVQQLVQDETKHVNTRRVVSELSVAPAKPVAKKRSIDPVLGGPELLSVAPEAVTTKQPDLSASVSAVARKPLPIASGGTTTAAAERADEKIEIEQASVLSGEILRYVPESRKVYLGLGASDSGIKPGKRFTVWRGDKYVTDIRVTQVFGVTSTCEVAGPTPIGIRTGDIAKLAVKGDANF